MNYDSINPENDLDKSKLFKDSIRKGFSESKDDLIKFIAFTTVLFALFMFFPRLKLLSVVIASITALCMDMIIPARLSQAKGEDLFSRLVTKIFKL